MLDYGLGALCGAVLGFGAAFFAQGGLLDRRLFLRLCRMPGRWRRQRWLLAGLGALLGVYIVWVQEGFGRGAAGLLLLTGLLLAASVTDLRRRQIHTDCLAVYAVLLFIWQCTGGLWNVLNGALGAALGLAALGIPRLVRPAAVGGGDVLLLAVCGLAAGFPGVVYLMFRGMVVLALVGVVQLALRRADRKSTLPLAPFLLLGALV